MTDFNAIMAQAQKMQANLEQAKADVANLSATGKSGGGLVMIELSGGGHMQGIKIDPSLIDPTEVEVLEDLIIAAFHDAKVKLDEAQAETMKSAMGDIQLPPGMKMPF